MMAMKGSRPVTYSVLLSSTRMREIFSWYDRYKVWMMAVDNEGKEEEEKRKKKKKGEESPSLF